MSSEQKTILIIDDEPADRAIVKHYLEQSEPGRFVFYEAATGRAGVSDAVRLAPDCILLDYNLPDLDGVAVLEQLRNASGELPFAVVMLTGMGDQHSAVAAMKLGVMDYVAKGPAPAESLAHTVRKAIEGYQLRRELAQQRIALEQRNAALEAIQRTLVAEKERYQLLIEAIPQLVWTSNRDGTIAFANQRMREFAGKSDGEHWDLTMLMQDDDKRRFADAWRVAIDTNHSFEIELRLRRASDGIYRWHLVRGVPLAAQGARALTWIGAAADIEDQKRSEEATRQQQKLDSIGLLAGGIAHDFNNLLVGILGGATCMLDTVGPEHPARPMLDMVVRAGERAAELTRQLLAYSGKREVFVELVDIARVLQDACELVRASMPKNVQLRWQADDIPRIQASPAQVQQLVMNLVINAAEAIGERNGLVNVEARLTGVPRRAVANVLGYEVAPGEYIELIVSDTGCGMSDEVRGKIFDPFFTTKFTGRGLGLAAVQGIIRSLGGAIEVSSSVGHGSTFRLLLPAKRSERVRADEGRVAAQQAAAVILVIDDEEIVRRTMQHALERIGHRVLCATDGPGGLELYAQYRDEIDLVLLDLSMPRMPGADVLRELRKITPGVRVAIISGYSAEEVAAHFHFEEGAPAGYIQKPFTSQTVVAAVTKLLQANREPQASRHAKGHA